MTKIESKLDGQSLIAYRLLQEAINDEGELKKGKGAPDCPVVPMETWRQRCYGGGVTTAKGKDSKRKAFDRAYKNLMWKYKLVRVWEDFVFLYGFAPRAKF